MKPYLLYINILYTHYTFISFIANRQIDGQNIYRIVDHTFLFYNVTFMPLVIVLQTNRRTKI